MEFAKYYNVTKLVDDMQKKEEIDVYPTEEKNKFVGVYVCMDTNDYWISRISKNLNNDYEYEEGIYLIERNKIDIYVVADKLSKLYNKELPIPLNKHTCHRFFDRFRTRHICKAVILLDNEDGLSNWDNYEAESWEDAIDMLDAGYGILPLVG